MRNRGTIGGSFCQADPAEDLFAVGSALRGTCVITSTSGTRTVPMREFHDGPYETAVADGEMLTEVRFPIRPRSGSAYEKVERRIAGELDASMAASTMGSVLKYREDGDLARDPGLDWVVGQG